ncbi:MAG: GNAT family N-acetyltransferase [Candidatus Sumerlaeota bacterium]
MSDIIRLSGSDFEEAMDFLNLVFSTKRYHEFENMLPVLYRPDDRHMSWNFAVKQSGRIRAIVGMFPMEWKVGDTIMRVAGIGGVSTHRNDRGAGYMKELMHHAVSAMGDEGYDLSWLSGQRQRYAWFGYENAGLRCKVHLNRSNIRHALNNEAPPLKFEKVEKDDRERLQKMKALHDAQPMRTVRDDEDYYLRLLSWRNTPWVALDASGEVVGYLVWAAPHQLIAELIGPDVQTEFDIAHAWVHGHTDYGALVELNPCRLDLLRLFGKYSERVEFDSCSNWLIFDWEKVIGALLQMRARMGPMPDGRVLIGIEDYGTLVLEVSGGKTASEKTDGPADIECDSLTATRLLLGPLPPASVMELPASASLLQHWRPLPAFWPKQDGV